MKRKKLIPEDEEQQKVEELEIVNSPGLADNEEIENESTLKFIVEPSRRKSVKKAKVFIEGELTIYNAKRLFSKVQEVLEIYELLDFKLREVKDFDLTAIQVLYYVKELYKETDKKITFHLEDLPMELKSLLVKTKYNKILFKKQVNPTS